MNRAQAPTASYPPTHLLFGHALQFLADKLGFLSRCAQQFGDVVPLWIAGHTFLLTSPDDIKYVLETNHTNYEKTHRLTSPRGQRLFGRGLLTKHSGESHLMHRRMMQPTFHHQVIARFAEIMTDTVEDTIRRWIPGHTVDVETEMMRLTQRVMGRLLLDVDYAGTDRQLGAAIAIRQRCLKNLFASLLPFPEFLPTPTNLAHRRALRWIDRALSTAIRDRRVNGITGHDLLSLLMRTRYKDGSAMTDRQLRDEALALSVTGYETTGVALAWTFYLLAQHPQVETKLRAELRHVLGARRPAAEDMSRLRYADMVLSEALRLYPPTWLYIRMANAADTLPSGTAIAPHDKLYLCPYVMHRHPRYYPVPAQFDPDRFADNVKQHRPKYSYFPFGGGPRVCIGQGVAMMEGLIALSCILSRFRLELLPGQEIEPEPGVTLRPKKGILMRLQPT